MSELSDEEIEEVIVSDCEFDGEEDIGDVHDDIDDLRIVSDNEDQEQDEDIHGENVYDAYMFEPDMPDSVEELLQNPAPSQFDRLKIKFFRRLKKKNEAAAGDPSLFVAEMALEESRRLNSDWCKCDGRCGVMGPESYLEEHLCCQEYVRIRARMAEDCDTRLDTEPDWKCITDHPGFNDVCLSVWSLQAAYPSFARGTEQERQAEDQASIDARYRYTAYRNFIRWIYGVVGKHARIPIPSCAARAINARSVPTRGGRGFRYPPLKNDASTPISEEPLVPEEQ